MNLKIYLITISQLFSKLSGKINPRSMHTRTQRTKQRKYGLHSCFKVILTSIPFLVSFNLQADISEIERKALLLIVDVDDEGFPFKSRVKDLSAPICEWYGVTCDTRQQHITQLDLSYVQIKRLEPVISQLSELQKLNLTGNILTTLPPEIGQLKKLKILILESNQLKELPPEIGQLTQLQILNLNYNLLTQLPVELGNLKNLKSLYINSNKVTIIPEEITQLPGLTDLQFRANWKLPAYNPDLISQETNQIIKKLQKKGSYVDNQYIGIAADTTEHFKNFIALKDVASKKELLMLVNHPTPAVRAYAFWALSMRSDTDVLKIIEQHYNDNEVIEVTDGCSFSYKPVGDFLIDLIVNKPGNSPDALPKSELSKTQRESLDSKLVNLPNSFGYLDQVLLQIQPDPILYPRIRELWTKEKKPAALVALAKYHKKRDIPLIVDSFSLPYVLPYPWNRSYTYKAVYEYPHPVFFPLLKHDFNDPKGNPFPLELYTAIANYRNHEAFSLLTTAVSNKSKEHQVTDTYANIFCALKQVSIPFYEPVFWKIWAEKYIVTPDVLNYLLEQNPDKTLSITIDTLQNIKTFDLNNHWLCSWSDLRRTTGSLLDIVLSEEAEFAYKVIINNILNNDSTLFPVFVNKAVNIKDTIFIQPLVQRLKTETNDYRYFVLLIRSLFSYDDLELTKRVNNIIDKKLASSFSHIKKENLLKHLNDPEFII